MGNRLINIIIVGLYVNTFLLAFYLVLTLPEGLDLVIISFLIGLLYFFGLYLAYKFGIFESIGKEKK